MISIVELVKLAKRYLGFFPSDELSQNAIKQFVYFIGHEQHFSEDWLDEQFLSPEELNNKLDAMESYRD